MRFRPRDLLLYLAVGVVFCGATVGWSTSRDAVVRPIFGFILLMSLRWTGENVTLSIVIMLGAFFLFYFGLGVAVVHLVRTAKKRLRRSVRR